MSPSCHSRSCHPHLIVHRSLHLVLIPSHLQPIPSLVPHYLGPFTCTCPLTDCLVFFWPSPSKFCGALPCLRLFCSDTLEKDYYLLPLSRESCFGSLVIALWQYTFVNDLMCLPSYVVACTILLFELLLTASPVGALSTERSINQVMSVWGSLLFPIHVSVRLSGVFSWLVMTS